MTYVYMMYWQLLKKFGDAAHTGLQNVCSREGNTNPGHGKHVLYMRTFAPPLQRVK